MGPSQWVTRASRCWRRSIESCATRVTSTSGPERGGKRGEEAEGRGGRRRKGREEKGGGEREGGEMEEEKEEEI